MLLWHAINPLAKPLAGWVPWWVLLETKGRRTGRPRRVPLARGPRDGKVLWLICVHGQHAGYAKNIAAEPRVRVRMRGRWHEGTAGLLPVDQATLDRFNSYARAGPRTLGIDPALVRVVLDP
jgi:deazaflavin-dependent oxidoreductase (nitroreductase family)